MRRSFTIWLACVAMFAVPALAVTSENVAVASGRARPAVTHEDETLGHLVLDKSAVQYVGKARWAGVDVDVSLSGDDADTLAAALETAHALWDFDADWDVRARRVAADQLLPAYNSEWRGDEPELDTVAFAGRLVPCLVVAMPDGEFELWFNDGGMFGGHLIRVVGSLVDGPQAADIVA